MLSVKASAPVSILDALLCTLERRCLAACSAGYAPTWMIQPLRCCGLAAGAARAGSVDAVRAGGVAGRAVGSGVGCSGFAAATATAAGAGGSALAMAAGAGGGAVTSGFAAAAGAGVGCAGAAAGCAGASGLAAAATVVATGAAGATGAAATRIG